MSEDIKQSVWTFPLPEWFTRFRTIVEKAIWVCYSLFLGRLIWTQWGDLNRLGSLLHWPTQSLPTLIAAVYLTCTIVCIPKLATASFRDLFIPSFFLSQVFFVPERFEGTELQNWEMRLWLVIVLFPIWLIGVHRGWTLRIMNIAAPELAIRNDNR